MATSTYKEKQQKLRDAYQQSFKDRVLTAGNIQFTPTNPADQEKTDTLLSSRTGVIAPNFKNDTVYETDLEIGAEKRSRFLAGIRRDRAKKGEKLKIYIDPNGKVQPLYEANFVHKSNTMRGRVDLSKDLSEKDLDANQKARLADWRKTTKAYMVATAALTNGFEFTLGTGNPANAKNISLLEVSEYIKLGRENDMMIYLEGDVMAAIGLAKAKGGDEAKLADSILKQFDDMKANYKEKCKVRNYESREAAFNCNSGLLELHSQELAPLKTEIEKAIDSGDTDKIKDAQDKIKPVLDNYNQTITDIQKELKAIKDFEKDLDPKIDSELIKKCETLRKSYTDTLQKAENDRAYLKDLFDPASGLATKAKNDENLEKEFDALQKTSREFNKNYLDTYAQTLPDDERGSDLLISLGKSLDKVKETVKELDGKVMKIDEQAYEVEKSATIVKNAQKRLADAQVDLNEDPTSTKHIKDVTEAEKNLKTVQETLKNNNDKLTEMKKEFDDTTKLVKLRVEEFNDVKSRVDQHVSEFDPTKENDKVAVFSKYKEKFDEFKNDTLDKVIQENVQNDLDDIKNMPENPDSNKTLKTNCTKSINDLESSIKKSSNGLESVSKNIDAKVAEYQANFPPAAAPANK